MNLELFYHIADLPGWERAARDEVEHMMLVGLWDRLSRAHFQLHYHPANFGAFIDQVKGLGGPAVTWRAWEDSERPLGEMYSMQDLHVQCCQYREPRAILRYHNKGITKQGTPAQPVAQEWQRYYQYWCVDQWPLCQEALESGYNTVGANWHLNPGAQARGHWSGNIWWARSDYLARLPRPAVDPKQSQYGGYSPRHDAELWIGMDWGCDMRLELHHYEHGCVYNVPPPRRYQLGRSRA